MTLDTILRESRYVSPLAGSLRTSILEAAMELGFTPAPFARAPLADHPIPRREFDPLPTLPVWRRRRNNRGQGLVEYALVLALIAVIAIIALLFLGGQVSAILNGLGESI